MGSLIPIKAAMRHNGTLAARARSLMHKFSIFCNLLLTYRIKSATIDVMMITFYSEQSLIFKRNKIKFILSASVNSRINSISRGHMTLNEQSKKMGERLKALREKKGISHSKLSSELFEKYKIGFDKTTLMNYEVNCECHTKFGKNLGMGADRLFVLADFYGVSTDYLLGITDIPTADINIRAICDYTGLTEASIDFLHWYISEKRNDTYMDGFTEDMFSPKNLINEILGGDTPSSSLDGFVSEFCHGVNGAAEPETDLMIARGSTPDDIKVSEMDWSEHVSSRELARLRVEHAKAEFLRILDEIFKEYCQSKQKKPTSVR